jgi:hypothetical protein
LTGASHTTPEDIRAREILTWAARKEAESKALGAKDGSLRSKMSAAARLKAEFARRQADCTETDWSGASHASGPYRFRYDYQRADLVVEGPDPYGGALGDGRLGPVIYTGGGMAAIATALIALRANAFRVVLPAGCYAETQELVRLLRVEQGPEAVLVDSAAPTLDLHGVGHARIGLFDTSCYAPTSRKLRRLVDLLLASVETLILVRSHHKLDMLGTEYGRLGSLVLMRLEGNADRIDLQTSLEDTARLIGAAARPEDFPPFAGRADYHRLTRSRTARIIANTRSLQQSLARAGMPHVRFQHGLYVDVELATTKDRKRVSALAQQLAEAFETRELRHAGSFGFDFTATEWTDHPSRDELALRIAPGDQAQSTFEPLSRRLVNFLVTRVKPASSRNAGAA